MKILNLVSMAMKIYTKTGDQGKTSLIGGLRVSKGHVRIESYGTIDELNSCLGLVQDWIEDEEMKEWVWEIQDRLFTIGSALATDPGKDLRMKLPDLKETDILWLEQRIDQMNERLPEMRSFVLPGGHPASSAAHMARCICRRAERACVAMTDQQELVPPLVIPYLNRLSDFLFVLSRLMLAVHGVEERPWRARV